MIARYCALHTPKLWFSAPLSERQLMALMRRLNHLEEMKRMESNRKMVADEIVHPSLTDSISAYGFLAPRRRTTLLPIIDTLLGQEKEKVVHITYAVMLKRLSCVDPHQCILCGSRLVLSGITSGLPWHQLMLHHESLAKMKGI